MKYVGYRKKTNENDSYFRFFFLMKTACKLIKIRVVVIISHVDYYKAPERYRIFFQKWTFYETRCVAGSCEEH